MAYNSHLNPMTEAEYHADVNIGRLRSWWSAQAENQAFASGRIRLAITESCNYACPFCYNEGSNGISRRLASRHVELILAAASPYVREIKLSGGEPLVHPEFDKIATICTAEKPTTLTTNGALLSRHVKSLSRLSGITVSIESLAPMVYAKLMGTPLTPQEIVEQIYECRRHLDVPFQINCVVTKSNLDNIVELCLFAREVGVTRTNLLGLLKFSAHEAEIYVSLTDTVERLRPVFGEPIPVTSTRLRYQVSKEYCVDVVYQYCMVGCDVCRTDGFIRVDPTPGLSYCLASNSISIADALVREDVKALRDLFCSAMAAMGQPTGRPDAIVLPKQREVR